MGNQWDALRMHLQIETEKALPVATQNITQSIAKVLKSSDLNTGIEENSNLPA